MSIANCWNDTTEYDYEALTAGLTRYLKLKTMAVGMKRFKTVADMEAVPRIRRPNAAEKLATDQVVGQARWIGWTIGITMDNLMGQQCGTVVGLAPRDPEFLSGERMKGVWYGTLEDSAAHQAAMSCASHGDYQALAVSPLTSKRLDNPDICLIYATPGQMITLINGLQYTGYRKYTFTVVGESACADSWGRALSTGEPSVSIPCYAERKFGGVLDDELLIALPPSYLPGLVEGLKSLDRNGLRYPIPNHGIQKSPLDSIETSYGKS
ncbi:MAG: DUF169 domain-containing protein [Gammaproteobacteria bacterium]|nr:DUF169 domain-containing protein [Gammaproteobacteria bacterium]